MSEPEQCIICLDSLPLPRSSGSDLQQGAAVAALPLPVPLPQVPPAPTPAAAAPITASNTTDNDHNLNIVAALDGCEHIIHEACIRSWAQKTNTCPICRNLFHTVRVFNGADGRLQYCPSPPVPPCSTTDCSTLHRHRDIHVQGRGQEASRRIRRPSMAGREYRGGARAEPSLSHLHLERARGGPPAVR